MGRILLPVSGNSKVGTQRNGRASQRSRSLAALQWNGVETAGIAGVRHALAAAVCDFASAGTVSLAHLAGAAKVAVGRRNCDGTRVRAVLTYGRPGVAGSRGLAGRGQA